jgi:hypothetical protein
MRIWKWQLMPTDSQIIEMPDDWQNKMADLLEQWDDTWNSSEMPAPCVSAKKDGKFTRWPSWLLNYRHPNKTAIEKMRITSR